MTLEAGKRLQDNDLGAVTSWAEQVELGDDGNLQSRNYLPEEVYDEKTGIKKVTEYSVNDEGKKVKIIKTYQVTTCKVSKHVAMRRKWKKFGDAKDDAPGPNAANTRVGEEMTVNYNIADIQVEEEDPLSKLKGKMVTCRICKGDHWTTKCPYKDSLAPVQENTEKQGPAAGASADVMDAPKSGKYVPPSMREGGNRKGESMVMKGRGDDSSTIRVSNLSEDARENDIQDLCRSFGGIARVFLAKDKATGRSRGYAFVTFYKREDAAKAILGLNGFGYDYLILQAEWSKPAAK